MSTQLKDNKDGKTLTEHQIKLTSAEIASLWTSYMNNSLSLCTIGTFLSHTEDIEIASVLRFALDISMAHVQKIKSFFNEEQLPVPDGFSMENDVNNQAPRLFTDDFHLFYIQNMGKIGMDAYTLSLSNSARLDMCEFFTECLNESARLYNKATEVMLSKGIFIRSPYIPEPKMVEYVQKQHYLAGWFGHKRPLNVIEIASTYFNLIQNQLGRSLSLGFSQVAKSQQVRAYMTRGMNIADKHVEVFGSLLNENHLPAASSWGTLPTDSTVSPFSDKLIMFHTLSLTSVTLGHYGASAGTSFRHDIASIFVRLSAEIANYAEDGANIMIENGWMEQPPQTTDRDRLAKK